MIYCFNGLLCDLLFQDFYYVIICFKRVYYVIYCSKGLLCD